MKKETYAGSAPNQKSLKVNPGTKAETARTKSMNRQMKKLDLNARRERQKLLSSWSAGSGVYL